MSDLALSLDLPQDILNIIIQYDISGKWLRDMDYLISQNTTSLPTICGNIISSIFTNPPSIIWNKRKILSSQDNIPDITSEEFISIFMDFENTNDTCGCNLLINLYPRYIIVIYKYVIGITYGNIEWRKRLFDRYPIFRDICLGNGHLGFEPYQIQSGTEEGDFNNIADSHISA